MALSITDLKKGTILAINSQPYRVVDYKQKVMGRGGSIVNVRVKGLIDGKVLDKTYKGSDQVDEAQVTSLSVQYLYNDQKTFFFMKDGSFEQFEVPTDLIGDSAKYIKEGDQVQLIVYSGRAISLELPKNVPLKVTYAEAAVKGDTSTAITKNATLETGIVIKVPAFIKQGDTISVDTASGSYRERLRG